MKNYKEIADSVFERKEQYETEKNKKRKIITRTVMPVCCVCLVALLSFGAWQSGIFGKHEVQILEDSVIPGEKDWYGPGEDEPTTNAKLPKPVDSTTAANTQGNSIDKPISPESTTGATNNELLTTQENNGFCEIIYTDSYIYKVEDKRFSEYSPGKIVEAAKVGNKIADVTVAAGWKNNHGAWNVQEKLRGEVFAINGIEQEVAVALKFIDKGEAVTTTHYYVIMNPNADLSAVEDYIISTRPDNSGEIAPE